MKPLIASATRPKRGQDMGTFAVAAMLETADADVSGYSEAEVIAAIEDGDADISAGRYISLEDYCARIDAEDAAATASSMKSPV